MMLPNIETSEQPSGSMFDDIPRSEDCSDERGPFMLCQDSFESYVFSLSGNDFTRLQNAVNERLDKERYGATSYEELALNEGRKAVCPFCESTTHIDDGYTGSGRQRYRCTDCARTYTLLHSSIFYSAKIPFHKASMYLALMTFNVPLEMLEELCDISVNTAMLWRKKIFTTVDSYQGKVWLRDRVWIDETYMNDASVLHDEGNVKKRGLSSQKICIIVAIDIHKNIYAKICGHGKPTSSRIKKALKDHIQPGSTIVHDGDNAHAGLIELLNLKSETYIADPHGKNYIENMALINNLCSWLKRYLFRFIGMDLENLQSYLNWFVYLFRVKGNTDKWPKLERIMRHLVLNTDTYVRKY